MEKHMEEDVASEEISSLSEEKQVELMRRWFLDRFEDPAMRTPYESSEGGYLWIWGGPYDAMEELSSEFGDIVSDDLIEELAGDLSADCPEWAPREQPGDFEDHLFAILSQQSEPRGRFLSATIDAEELLKVPVPTPQEDSYCRILFVSIIAALEAYLSETFIGLVASNDALLRRYVESAPEFKEEKFTLAEIYKASESLEKKVKSTLVDLVWHNLAKVKQMYSATLEIEFPSGLSDIYRAIEARHDIVHRNGKRKDGSDVVITRKSVEDLIVATELLVRDIDQQVAELKAQIDVS